MKPRRSPEHQRVVLERRRSSAASPIPSGKKYKRKPKHPYKGPATGLPGTNRE